MEKDSDKILQEFFRSLKIALANASTYTAEHSVFLKSIDEMHAKTEAALTTISAIEIFVAPRYLKVEERKWEKDPLYEDLARLFHHRNIKSIKIKKGVSLDELQYFVAKAALRPKDLLQSGGLAAVLAGRNLVHVTVEMLDYSEILKSTREDKDIWAFLLHKAIDDENFEQIETIIDNLEFMVKNLAIKDFTETEKLPKGLVRFLGYLKGTNPPAFLKCAKTLLVALLRNKVENKDIPAQIPDEVKAVFHALPAEQLGAVLLGQWAAEENLSLWPLELYSRLIFSDKHSLIAATLLEKIAGNYSEKFNQEWLKKLTEMLAAASNAVVAEIYYPAFASALQTIRFAAVFRFEKESVPAHYRGVLLALLSQERELKALSLVVEKILEEWERIEEAQRLAYYKILLETLEARKDTDLAFEPIAGKIHTRTAQYIDGIILQGKPREELEYFIATLRKSSGDFNVYLDKIFKENMVSAQIVKSFFRFFPARSVVFYEKLNHKLEDTNFLLRLIESAKGLPPLLALEILKKVYDSANLYIKNEAMTRMEGLSVRDENFLLSILKVRNAPLTLKEKALRVLMQDASGRRAALDALFSIPNGMGKNNALLHEHVRLAGKLGLKDARDILVTLSHNRALWNRNLRKETLDILERWDYGKD
jgi:hypothetical protein